MGVTGAVVSLVVLGDRVSPRTEPPRKRRCQPRSLERVILYDGPLLIIELVRLVEGTRVNSEFAYVVEERGPTETVAITCRQVQLIGDEVGESSHPFAMTARQPIMGIESRCQRQDLLRGHDRLVDSPVRPSLLDSAGEVPCASRPAGDCQTLGCLVGEDHGHLEQHRQRQRSTGEPLGSKQDDGGYREDGCPPSHQ